MSMQLFNPESKKLVNVSAKQVGTLKKAGWLSPDDKDVKEFLAEKKAKAEAEAKAKTVKKTIQPK